MRTIDGTEAGGVRRPDGRVALGVAALVAVAVVASLTIFVDSEPEDVGVSTRSLAPAVFDQQVAPVCTSLRAARPARNASTVASAREVLALVASARAALRAVPSPSDDPELLTGVLDDLAVVEHRAQDVIDVAPTRPGAASAVWGDVNTYLDLVLSALARHGVAACAQ